MPSSSARRCRWRWPASAHLRIDHDDIVAPLLRQWGIWELEGLDADGEAARDELRGRGQGAGCRGEHVRREARGTRRQAGRSSERLTGGVGIPVGALGSARASNARG